MTGIHVPIFFFNEANSLKLQVITNLEKHISTHKNYTGFCNVAINKTLLKQNTCVIGMMGYIVIIMKYACINTIPVE